MGFRATPTDRAPVIAFAGGGASAALAVIALMRTTTWLRLDYRVILLDEHGRHARGAAFSADDGRRLLDTPVKAMSALPDQPCHLMDWARGNGLDCGPETLLPLRAYGDYLAATLADTAAWAAPHAALRWRTGRVARAWDEEDRAVVELADGQRLDSAAAVVATGDPAAAAPPRIDGFPALPPRGDLSTCARGALRRPAGGVARRLFAIGPVRREDPGTTIPQIRDQAERLAQRIADTVLRNRPDVLLRD
ncbi:MAG: FAD/NAD(P)-binding protein [Nocardiopsaceae bacterium]|nr:FAD/NAD(P)-binding protein [Nocardiopsaceae bacterium]